MAVYLRMYMLIPIYIGRNQQTVTSIFVFCFVSHVKDITDVVITAVLLTEFCIVWHVHLSWVTTNAT